MPIYVYRCERCGEESEVVQPMSGPPLRKCPACKSVRIKRVFHPVGIAFKGSGFYKTDSRTSKKPSDEAKSPESKAAETKASTDKKTDTKKTDSKKSE